MQILSDYADLAFFKKLANQIGLVHKLGANGFVGYSSLSHNKTVDACINYCSISSLKYTLLEKKSTQLDAFYITVVSLKSENSMLYCSIVTDPSGIVTLSITEEEL